ncbi:hypothetical protein M885DRAFT_445437, partial [Pelagophyceae sp. CCMP2097]
MGRPLSTDPVNGPKKDGPSATAPLNEALWKGPTVPLEDRSGRSLSTGPPCQAPLDDPSQVPPETARRALSTVSLPGLKRPGLKRPLSRTVRNGPFSKGPFSKGPKKTAPLHGRFLMATSRGPPL